MVPHAAQATSCCMVVAGEVPQNLLCRSCKEAHTANTGCKYLHTPVGPPGATVEAHTGHCCEPPASCSSGHCWVQILQQAEQAGGRVSGGQGDQQKRTEAKLVLQLATWMANTGQGAKSDIIGTR